ncbi:hypothetical protein OCK74_09995 [Chitinophagaceae bacterium LB-8]|uniref:Alpha/beta hydrolase n=1 Tax=Paraflavisolibacter caeni TaxID=2982496 RepID=A0A9X2XVP0_9BACT|nr:hypothetical protein [Paraflavisolibacter caeni]MCU7549447.1 hypothetical protein [Paraflavisolibacter caeni]
MEKTLLIRKHFIAFIIFILQMHLVRAAEWQWSVEVKSVVSSETNGHPRAFLWIPPDCKQVRGVVVGQHNMTEEGILEHPHFRKAMTELGFAEVWVSPGINVVFDFNREAGEQFNEMMQSLANESGYTELALAPVVPIGHSALASFPWNFATWNPARTLAILSIHGDAPLTNLTGSGRPNPEWGNRNIEGIPGLMVIGEYEWMEERVSPAMKFRSMYPNAPISLLADAGHGHFDYSDALIKYLALFIQKAAKYRLPATISLDKPASLKPVDPKKGWLLDKWRKDEPLKASAATYTDYKGDRAEAFWYFDQEIARATEQYYAVSRGKRPQYLRFAQERKLVPYTGGHPQYRPQFMPMDDGISFKITPVFSDTIFRNAEKPLVCTTGHAGGDPVISRICGPVVQTGTNTFRLQFYRMGMNNPRRSNDIWLLASHPGDQKYKSVVQQADIRFPLKNTEGAEQKITFPALGDQKESVKTLTLGATSNSGMQVYYYVQEGPAEIEGNILKFTKIPPRSKFPVKVTVVAWQYGRSMEPKVQSAQPVIQSFFLTK